MGEGSGYLKSKYSIYLYYGNTGETAASNFDNTFTKNSEFSGLVAHSGI
jgi:hypothetical protein